MMKKRKQGVVIATCLALIAIIILSGCGQRGQDMKSQKDLMEGIAPGFVSTDAMLTENGNEAAIDFSVRLFQQSYEPLENTLLAPMSVFLCAFHDCKRRRGKYFDTDGRCTGDADRREQ